MRKFKVWVEEVVTTCGYVEVEVGEDPVFESMDEEQKRRAIENLAEQKVIDNGMPETSQVGLSRSATYEG